MKLLRFQDEAEMYYVLGDVPACPFGTVRVRGILGNPGVYEMTGELGEDGEPVMIEIEPANPWPGYHAEIDCADLPAELQAYVVQPEEQP